MREVVKKGEQASAASPVRTTAVHVVQASRANQVRTRPADCEHEPEMLRQIVGGGGTFVVRSRANEGTTYIPGTVEEAKVATAANAFLETVYRCDLKPRPRPGRDMRSAPENHWLMTEAGVAQQEDGKREVCYIPDMRVKAVWIPSEMRDLVRVAYELMETEGHRVPENYGAVLHVTRMATQGIAPHIDNELMYTMAHGVFFNLAHTKLMIGGVTLDAPYATATVFQVNQSYGLSKGTSGAEYAVLVRFVQKGRRVFRWSTWEEWLQNAPASEGEGGGEEED